MPNFRRRRRIKTSWKRIGKSSRGNAATPVSFLKQGPNLAARGEHLRGFLLVARGMQEAPEGAEDLLDAARVHYAELARSVAPLRAVLPHGNPHLGVLFSPDGKRLLTGDG